MANVKALSNPAGDVALGIVSDGIFVPIASISAARIGHYVQRGHDLAAKAEAGDENAVLQLAAEFGADKDNGKGEKSEGGSK